MMEVDENIEFADGNVARPTVTVLLHPLVILNISEHWMREKLAHNSTQVNVHGALLGKQNGRHVEVTASFELLLDEQSQSIDIDFFNVREGQSKQIYPDLDFIGWYTNGGAIDDHDKAFNAQMQEINESLLIFKLDPIGQFGEQLPIRVYESAVNNDAQVLFKQVPFSLAHDAMERIGVDHIARVSSSSSSQDASITAEYMLGNYQAVQMLSKRLHLLRSYVRSVTNGELPANWARLRDISSILGRLPLAVSEMAPQTTTDGGSNQGNKLLCQANDVCLSALLGSLTQSMSTLHTLFLHSTQARRTGTAAALSSQRMELPTTGARAPAPILPSGEEMA